MANYCFANFQKNKRNSVSHLQKEANREWENEEKYKSEVDFNFQNIFLKKTENWNEKIDEILEENGLKARSNSVVMTTTIYGFSEEWEEDLLEKYSEDEVEQIKIEYFKKCFEFEQTRGECFNFVIHTDEEGNWHAHAATVPITQSFVTKAVPQVDKDGNIKRCTKKGSKSFGKIIYKQEPVKNEDGSIKTQKALSAKAIFGNRKKMSDEQTRFYESCGKAFGMERGEIRLQDKPATVIHLTETEFKAQKTKENAMNIADFLKSEAQKKSDEIIANAKAEAKAVNKALDDREIKLTSREKKIKAREASVTSFEAALNERGIQISQQEEEARRMANKASEMLKESEDILKDVRLFSKRVMDKGAAFDVSLINYIRQPFLKYPKIINTIDKRADEYYGHSEVNNVIERKSRQERLEMAKARLGTIQPQGPQDDIQLDN